MISSPVFVHQSRPKDFCSVGSVVACFVEVGDTLLFVKRATHTSQGGLWCVPGGKLEQGESAEAATIRELQEETGIQLDAVRFISHCFVERPDLQYELHLFAARLDGYPDIDLDVAENSEYRWLTIQEGLELPLIIAGPQTIKIYLDSIAST